MNKPDPMTFEKATVFLTGANGFVGSHTVRHFVESGHHVRALVRPNADLSLVQDLPCEWIIGDLHDVSALRQGCDNVDWVVHIAGRVNALNREAYFQANRIGTENVLQAANDAAPSLKRFVFLSSLAAGGPSHNGTIRTESVPDSPITPYGESKRAGEQAVMSYADRIPVVALRPPAVYGPGDTEILGMIRTVQLGLKPTFGDRSVKLSLVYVEDLARAIYCACLSPDSVGQLFYVADPTIYAMEELEDQVQTIIGNPALRIRIPRPVLMTLAAGAEIAGRLFGFTPLLTKGRAENFLQNEWTCSPEKIRRTLGFETEYPFTRGGRLTIDWYRSVGWM